MAKKRTNARRTAEYDFSAMRGVIDMVAEAAKSDKELLQAYDEAYKAGFALPREVIRQWFASVHRRTGTTAGALHDSRTTYRDGVFYHSYGYDPEKGGYTAVYFEYGTPRIQPEFVIYFSVKDNQDVVTREIKRSLIKFLRDRGLDPDTGAEY